MKITPKITKNRLNKRFFANDDNFIEYICFYISINITPIIPRTMPILFVKDKSSLKIKTPTNTRIIKFKTAKMEIAFER